jgi:hypothetical protein
MIDQKKSPPALARVEGLDDNTSPSNDTAAGPGTKARYPDPSTQAGQILALLLGGGGTGSKATADALADLGWPIKSKLTRPRIRIHRKLQPGGMLYRLAAGDIEAAGEAGRLYSKHASRTGLPE